MKDFMSRSSICIASNTVRDIGTVCRSSARLCAVTVIGSRASCALADWGLSADAAASSQPAQAADANMRLVSRRSKPLRGGRRAVNAAVERTVIVGSTAVTPWCGIPALDTVLSRFEHGFELETRVRDANKCLRMRRGGHHGGAKLRSVIE